MLNFNYFISVLIEFFNRNKVTNELESMFSVLSSFMASQKEDAYMLYFRQIIQITFCGSGQCYVNDVTLFIFFGQSDAVSNSTFCNKTRML